MKFTGERFIPTEQGRIRLEHYHRYAIVLDIVAGKDVLDLACGEGYGSYLLADVARSVVGVDISKESIRHASKTYKKSNLTFQQGSAIAVGVADNSFDVVVSFETIEHLAEQTEMIAEIRRVLRPDGFLVISSPNRPVYSEESGEHNEFHVKELDFEEFDDLLKTQFPSVQYYGQRMLMGSVIQTLEGGQSSYQVWNDDGKNLNPQSTLLTDPVYFVAIAGDSESYLPSIDSSVIYPKDLDLVKHYVGFAKWAQDLNVTVAERDKYIANLDHEIQMRDQHLSNLNQTVSNLNQTVSNLNQTVSNLNQTVSERDQQITKRDEQISNLNQFVSERDKQILHLNQIVSEHNEQIHNLNQNLSERNQEISNLNQSIAERNLQITNLNQSVTERDEHINTLNQSIAERDRRIVSLDDEVVRRGEWGLGLDAELKEAWKQLNEQGEKFDTIVKSNSWRITLPLREAKLWISTPNQQTKRYTKKSLQLVKRFYQSRYNDIQTVENHRGFFVKYAPHLLTFTETRFDGKDKSPASIAEAIEESKSNIPKIEQDKLFLEIDTTSEEKAATIEIPTSENPLVSVIIPIYGKVAYTLNCLISMAANLPRVPFEIIVIDDCSPDESYKVLENVKGIRLIQNDKNQGFIRSCNSGAKQAKGKFVYFLNNDTQVTSGWLDELVRTFHEFPETGLAGSKLIYPDGRLQEAGGIIWQDGSAWNFGRFQDPQLPIYNYAREVDYCSGASIMIPKSLFDELVGFDEHYLPAYCEDSDLALKIRDKGYRVIYQPLSTVIHYEGITSGTDTREGAKSYQVENSKKLYQRWKDRLATHQISGIDADNAKDRRAKRRVLVLEHCTPTPNQDAGSVTVYNLMLLLREMDFQVTFIPEDNFLYMPEYTTALQRVGIEVLYAPFLMSVEQHLKESGERYDLAFLFRPLVVERNIQNIRKYCSKAKVLYYTHDLHFLRMAREAELFHDAEKQQLADEMKSRELGAIKSVDASILVSNDELEIVRREIPDEVEKLHTLPLILDIPGTTKGFSERKDIVFVGGFQHTPNIDAVQYFVSEIMPRIREHLPGVRFYAVGSNPPEEITALATDDVIITGFVEELNSFLDRMRISVAPLRYGAGIKGKIGTAMAAALPVVATNLAVEGMSLTNGDNILVADNPTSFAKNIIKLYQDEKLWDKLSQNGLTFAKMSWGAESVWKYLADILRFLELNVTRSKRWLTLYNSFTNLSLDKDLLSGISTIESDKINSNQSTVEENYQKKIQQELAIYEKQLKVHDLPEIFHYWSDKYLSPMFQEAGFSSIDDFFTKNLLEAQKRTSNKCARFVSIGAGNCDLEVSVAKGLVAAGCEDFIFECVELNPAMIERGRVIAKENGVFENMRFVKSDFNTWVAKEQYEGIIANQSLHHVTNLEHLFEQIEQSLHVYGSFIISDMIGRNGHQRWQESIEIVNKFWKELPESYKFNVLLNRHEEEYINWDCSKEGFEGIRAQDILPLLIKKFQFEKFIGFGSAIDIFVDRCFGHHFNPNSECDKEIIDRVHLADEEGLRQGKLTPTHMLGVCVKTLRHTPFYSRSLDPISSVRHP